MTFFWLLRFDAMPNYGASRMIACSNSFARRYDPPKLTSSFCRLAVPALLEGAPLSHDPIIHPPYVAQRCSAP